MSLGGVFMQELKQNELFLIAGGINISGTLLKSFSSLINSIAELGRNFGSAIRRIGSNKMCAL